jgi:hypothetical protein
MPQYIFSLEQQALQGTSQLMVAAIARDETIGEMVSVEQALKPGFYVSTFDTLSIPDSTTISQIAIEGSTAKIDLSSPISEDIEAGTDIFFRNEINRVNKINVGNERKPVPKITEFVQLVDVVTGESLIDRNSNPLVTQAKVPVRSQASASRASSLVVSNDKVVKVREVFPEASEVSISLLGIPKSETQLGLFSDVSVLGLDEDTWEYKIGIRPDSYGPWENRKTLNNDDHYPAAFREASTQQALELTCFPPPYKYPWQPLNANVILSEFIKFKTFIELGSRLFNYFKTRPQYGSGFANNFLDGEKVKIGNIALKDILDNNTNRVLQDQLIFEGVTEEEGFLLIDIWTDTFLIINANALIDITTGLPFTFRQLANFAGYGPSEDPFAQSQPGYLHSLNSPYQNEVSLESKRSFRYQPGRISGFTFGIKASSDSGSENNIVEWGTYNTTDQYLFQIRGANINIVRRSTIPLPDEVLETYGLPSTHQTSTIFTDTATGKQRVLYEVVIPRDLWNVDPLNGNGPSRYLLTSKQVTMYKIEFSWYGAVGASFYAYIPVDNNECRWVLLNKLIIENKMGKVCLEDPYFKFKYYLGVRDPKNLRTPQFLYKYGASYYIDGGDEGSNTQTSVSGNVKNTNNNRRSILLGVYPKPTIQNSQGEKKRNKKTIIPTGLTVTSTQDLAKVDVVTCRACPGFGYTYEQGLTARDTLSNHITFYYDNLNTVPRIRTKFLYPVLGIDYSTTSVTVTAERYPNKFRQDDIFKFVSDGELVEPVYRIDNVTLHSDTLTFNVSSSTGEFPETSPFDNSNLEFLLYNQLFTADNHLNKIFVEGLYGYYIDMEPIISSTNLEILVDTIDDKEYFSACNLYKLVWPYKKEKITSSTRALFRSTTSFNWTTVDAQTPAVSGGLGSLTNGRRQIRTINHDHFTEKSIGNEFTTTFYPRDMVVSNWNTAIAASDHPILGRDTDIQFLIPHTVRYNTRQIADFVIGVTTKKPVEIDNEVKFDYDGQYRDLDDKDFLFIEYMGDRVEQDFNIEVAEVVRSYNERFIIDREMPRLDQRDGGGACSKINLTSPTGLEIKDCNYITGAELIADYGVPANKVSSEGNYIITQDLVLADIEIDIVGGEVGINGSPGGIRFTTKPEKITVLQDNITFYYVGVSDKTNDENFVLNLSFIRLTYPTGDGILHKRFDIVGPNYKDKIFNFNPYPLYLVVKMFDRSRINSINIKENFNDTQQVTSPKWLKTPKVILDTVNGKAPSNEDLTTSLPENFISKNRLDACSYDVQGNRIIRESAATTKASYFVGPGETKKISLDSVFGLDKTVITQDLYGLDAVFVTGLNERSTNNQLQVTLNISEQ